MRTILFTTLTVATIAVTSLLGAGGATAHNAGHIHLPNGECQDVGSGKHANNPAIDRYPATSGDEYGTRWAADQGHTPIWPRHCDDPRPDTHQHP